MSRDAIFISVSAKESNAIGLTFSMLAMAIGMLFLFWILSILLYKGFSAISPSLFLANTPAPGTEGGGLANPIIGSLMIVSFCTLISTPIGILAGIYLSEYGQNSKIAEVTRFVTDIMLSAPSIVIGLICLCHYCLSGQAFLGMGRNSSTLFNCHSCSR